MAEAKLNFDENLLDKDSPLYKLYKKLYDGMEDANKVDPPDFITNPPKKADGSIDQETIATKLKEYSVILMKNSAYLFAKSIIDELGDGAISFESLADLLIENKATGDMIVYDGTTWKNVPKSSLNLSDMNNDAQFVTKDEIPSIVDSDKNFVFKQSQVSKDWVIEHNLNKMPTVTVIDSAGSAVIGDIEYDQNSPNNKLTLHFSAAFSGTATLN